MARILARRGRNVLALDSDTMPGLALSLGAEAPNEPLLNEAAERPEGGRWRLKRGIGPVRAVERFSTPAPDGVRLLQIGKVETEGLAPVIASVQAFYQVIHRLDRAKTFDDWAIVGDLPAGPRQTAFDWAPYADVLLVLTEPTWKSVLSARRIARIARSRSGVTALPVASKVCGRADRGFIEQRLGEPLFGTVPADDAVREAERLGAALIDRAPESPAVRAVERLVAALERR
jgi:CO dehydrogenase maturation factor